MNKLKHRVGIIGGAGPMAGALLFEKIIEVCQKKYGCTHDADFPYSFLINYPFSNMLTSNKNEIVIKSQLEECFNCFLKNNITIGAIACNTLHAFLDDIPKSVHLVHMIEETKSFLTQKNWKNPLILCSSTSAETKLHARFFSCRYPIESKQKIIDALIDKITLGACLAAAADELNKILEDDFIILGCTELSLLNEKVPIMSKTICDPNSIVAEKICELIFKN